VPAGVLAVRGVTRPVSLAVDSVELAASGSFTARGKVRIDRTEFGITAMRGLAGRYLELSVEVQCVRK
jgi:polyisoprenoid-binding protein YceI